MNGDKAEVIRFKNKLKVGHLHYVELHLGKSIFKLVVDKFYYNRSNMNQQPQLLDLQKNSIFIGGYPQERIEKVTNGKYSSGFGGCVGEVNITHLDNYHHPPRNLFFSYQFNDKFIPSENFLMYHCIGVCSLALPPYEMDKEMPSAPLLWD